MKYMTPDLLAQFRSENDDIADAAAAEWDRQCEAYIAHLKEVRPSLSPGARRLLRHYNFHDAKMTALAADDVPHFSIFVELDDPAEPDGKKNLELRYRLVGGPPQGFEVKKHEALVGDGRPFGWWLYDEFDVSTGDVPAMTHSILFTGGYEIRLTFFSVSCRRLDFLSLPADENGLGSPKVAGQWASLKELLRSGTS